MSEIIIPSEAKENWKSVRKSQWKFAKNTLKSLGMDAHLATKKVSRLFNQKLNQVKGRFTIEVAEFN